MNRDTLHVRVGFTRKTVFKLLRPRDIVENTVSITRPNVLLTDKVQIRK